MGGVVSDSPGTLQTPPATTATTKPPATASTSHSTTATLAQYKTEADAKGACGSDPIVWANTSSKVLHHGCLMLSTEAPVGEGIESSESGGVSVLTEGAGSVAA